MWKRVAGVVAVGLAVACGGGGSGEPSGPGTPPPVTVASVTVEPGSATILVGGTVSLVATVRDASGNALSGRTVTWASSNASVVTVNASGIATAVAAGGPVTITASSEGKIGTAQVTVQPPVASVALTPATATLLVDSTLIVSVTLRDANNNAITGRPVAWTSGDPSVATVSPAGVITAVAPGGPVAITATVEGKSGTALVTVLAPVASVTMTGSSSVKVGDIYTYTATARLANGTIVVRPVTWSVTDPTRGSMSTSGLLVPLAKGSITIVATIDGRAWQGTTIAYDWESFGSGSTVGVYLTSDSRITNKFGTSEYPTLAFGCSGGLFLAYVDTDHFITQSGLVAYAFDGGTPITQTWLEFDTFSALGHPGPSQATRTFAAAVATSRSFAFAFNEYNSVARAMIFRVTGLGPKIAGWLTACPSASAIVSGEGRDEVNALGRLQTATGRVTALTAERKFREELRAVTAAGSPSHALRLLSAGSGTERMMRPQ